MKLLFILLLGLGLAQEYGRLCVNNSPSTCMDECDYYYLTPDPLESCNFPLLENYLPIKYFNDDYPGFSFSSYLNQTVKIDGYETFCVECSGIEVVDINPFFYGDLDGDLSLNIIDAVLMINIILEEITPTFDQSVASDINNDGLVNILDTILLINEIIGNGILNQQCIENGSNLVTFNCSTSMNIPNAIPESIAPFVHTIVGEGSSTTYIPGMGWIGSLLYLSPYTTYWFSVSGLSDITCFTFDCVTND